MALSIPKLTLVFSCCWSIFCLPLVSADAGGSPSSKAPKQETSDKDLLAASNRDTILIFVIVLLVIAIISIIVWYLTKKPALEPKEQCLLDSDSNPNYGTMIDVLTTQIFVASDLSRVTVSLNPRQPLRILHEKTLTVSFAVDQSVSNSARKLLGSGDLVPSSLVAPHSKQNFATVRIWRDKHERFTGVLFQTSQPRQVASVLLYASPVAVVAIGDPSAVVEYRRSGHNTTISMIFIHYLTAPIKSTSDPRVHAVKEAIALPGGVALMHRVSGRFVPIIKSDFETHVFLCPATEPSNTHNEDTLAVVVELITEALPRTDVNLGACIAAAMTEAADGNATLSFNTDGSFTAVAHNTTGVDMRSGSTRPTDRVGWRLLVESDWSHTSSTETTEPASQAYVLEFKMDGLNDAAAEAEVRRQLAWGEGIKLERRGRSVSEEVTVNVRGPNGQRLRALTSLQEHNVGESGAPVVVRVSVDGVVRVQFWPGQIDDQ